MKTTSTLAAVVSIAIISVPAMAIGNSEVWRTVNGSAVVDSSGNPIRTIHYKNNKVALFSPAPKANTSLIKVIKKAGAKVLEVELVAAETAAVKQDIKPVLVAEQKNVAVTLVKKTPQVVINCEPTSSMRISGINNNLGQSQAITHE